MPHLGSLVTFECETSTITMIDNADLSEFGLKGGWAYYDDLYINPHVDCTLDVSSEIGVDGIVEHTTGDPVIRFGITSREPNGEVDVRIHGLSPESWYRLRLDNKLAEADGGRAHGQTTNAGVIQFNNVVIPNE